MADRLVTHVAKDRDGDILVLLNPNESWAQRHSSWAISDIVAERHRYFVQGVNDSLHEIHVVNGPHGRYLRSSADVIENNNLDFLPDSDVHPWEVALDDAEILSVHAALIPVGQGQIMMMGGDEHDKSNADAGEIHNSRLYDVQWNTINAVDSPPADVFCCGHAFLGDGRLMVAGGTEGWNDPPDTEEGEEDHHVDAHGFPRNHWSGSRDCAIYNPADQQWEIAAQLLTEPGQDNRGGGRWYPTLVTLANGNVLAVGGHPLVDPNDESVNDGRHGAWLPEIYNPETNSWTYTEGHWLYVSWGDVAPEVTLPEGQQRPEGVSNYLYYPRLFMVPGGTVFMASPNDGHCGWYDPDTGLINDLLIDAPPHDDRGYAETSHTAVLLPLLSGDNYTPHILFLGFEGPHRISLDVSEDNTPSWQSAGDRDWGGEDAPLRRHGCVVILPTGEIFFTGGINDTESSGLPDSNAVLEAEVYSSNINWQSNHHDFDNENWATTPAALVPRNYHSVALLLPNGRVFTAGSNLNGSSGGDGVKEYRIEIYTPWYDGDPSRPTILTAPDELTYNQSFSVHGSRAGQIERAALIRCGSVTHAWDGDQRYVGIHLPVRLPS